MSYLARRHRNRGILVHAAFEAQVAAALPLSEYLLTHLRDQVDMQHLEGGAKLAALARPLFAKMPDGVELLADRWYPTQQTPAGQPPA